MVSARASCVHVTECLSIPLQSPLVAVRSWKHCADEVRCMAPEQSMNLKSTVLPKKISARWKYRRDHVFAAQHGLQSGLSSPLLPASARCASLLQVPIERLFSHGVEVTELSVHTLSLPPGPLPPAQFGVGLSLIFDPATRRTLV